MRGTIVFDTLEYVEDLKRGGVEQNKAEAITKANAKAFKQMMEFEGIVTKQDLYALKAELQSFIVKTIMTSIMILGSLQTLFHFLG